MAARYYRNKNLLNKACLLDPHFKVLSFLSQREKNDNTNNAKEEAPSTSEAHTALVDSQTKKFKREKV